MPGKLSHQFPPLLPMCYPNFLRFELSLLVYMLALVSRRISCYQLCTFPPPTLRPSAADLGIREPETYPLSFADLIPHPHLYDKMRPPKNETHPTVVEFHVTVMGLDSINEYSMTYAADIFLAQKWKDDRLRLPENMTAEYRLLELDFLNKMWRPDAFIKNAKQVTFQTMTVPNHYVWLYKDKSLLYMVKLTLTLSCAMNFKMYPHDTQECKLEIESLSHTTEDLIFQWMEEDPLIVDPDIELPQLQLNKNKTGDCTQNYSTGNFSCLEVIFVLERRLGYYVFHTYIPTCLIVVMSWVSFWIQPEAAPARVTLGVTSLLTLSTQHAKSQAALPPVTYLKAVDIFMSTCTLFVFLALMEYCLVNIVLGDSFDTKARKAAEEARSKEAYHLASARMNNFRGSSMDHQCSRTMSTSSMIIVPSMSGTSTTPPPPPPPPASRAPTAASKLAEKRRRALAVDRFSRVAFPLTFTVLNCIYWIYFADYL